MTANGSILPLRLRDVGFQAGEHAAVRGITAEFGSGSRTVILGPNGAGKSVLLRLCHGLIRPTSGSIAWGNGVALPETAIRARQAMVFQRPVLLRRSALGNITHALGLAGVARAERRELALAALASFGLALLAHRSARVLSGGEQQRLALARAWALHPEVLFLDEPTASLDPAATRAVENAVQQFHAAGTKVVMTTHDLGQARRLADDILFLWQGRLVESAPAELFFRAPKSAEARAFLKGELQA
jgi:tungstate transport system ATP-binding protein